MLRGLAVPHPSPAGPMRPEDPRRGSLVTIPSALGPASSRTLECERSLRQRQLANLRRTVALAPSAGLSRQIGVSWTSASSVAERLARPEDPLGPQLAQFPSRRRPPSGRDDRRHATGFVRGCRTKRSGCTNDTTGVLADLAGARQADILTFRDQNGSTQNGGLCAGRARTLRLAVFTRQPRPKDVMSSLSGVTCRDLLSSSVERVRVGLVTVELEEAPCEHRNGT